MQLQRAVHSLAEADNRLPLDAFIDAHVDDEWGSLARNFRAMHAETMQLDKQNRALAAEKQTLSQQNQALQQQLQALQSKLEELTRSLIEQERRQP